VSLYANLAATATRLLTKFGAATTITRSTPGAYDPATSSAAVTTTSTPATVACFPYGDEHIDGTLILAGDEQAFVSAAVTFEPKPGDVLTWRGASYTAIRCKTIAPAGVAVLHELQVRKG
jgi:hypothetical protein